MTQSIIVMGVTGSGKSTLGSALARALGWPFLEGDTLHPAANIAKMAAGTPLTDADRIPFLENVANAIVTHQPYVVLSCSALKRSYRDRIRRADPELILIYPDLTREQLQARLQHRQGHFMPAALLDSQLGELEPPAADERCIRLEGSESTERQVETALAALKSLPAR